MILARKRLKSPRLELTPLVDVVFLLLTFYMLTSTFIKDHGIPLALPQAASAEVKVDQLLTLSIIDDEKIQINQQEIAINELEDYLAAKMIAEQGIVIRAAKNASVQTFVSVLDLVRKSGANNVTIATDKVL